MVPWLAVASTVLLLARQADAQPQEGEQRLSTRVVMLCDRSAEEMNADVFQAVIGQLSDFPVDLLVEWLDELPDDLDAQLAAAREAASHGHTLAVFWIVAEAEDHLLLHLADAGSNRVLIRRLDRSEAGAQYEALALIVHASIDALLKGGVIGIEPPAAAEPVAEPAPEPPPTSVPGERRPETPPPVPPRPPWLGLEVGYDVAIHSDEHPLLHGVRLVLSASPVAGLIIRAGYVLRTPVVVEADLVTILVEHHPAFAGVGYYGKLGPFALGGSVSLTADYAVQTTNRLTSPTGVGQDNSALLVTVTPSVDIGFELNDRVALLVSAGPEIITNNFKYIYRTNTGVEVILAPWSVQPRIFAGVGVWMF